MEIIVADELPLVRVGLRALLLERSLVPSAEVGLNAELDAYLDAQMDGTCLLLGSLPDAELLEVAQAWVHRGAKVALLVARVTAEDIAAGELLGIQQICLRHSEQSEIAAWIEATVLGMPYRSAALTELVALTPIATTDAELLSPREHAVLRLLVEGRSNREIAAQLFITVATVKSHIQKIYAKLEVANRNEALGRALALGLIGNR